MVAPYAAQTESPSPHRAAVRPVHLREQAIRSVRVLQVGRRVQARKRLCYVIRGGICAICWLQDGRRGVTVSQ